MTKEKEALLSAIWDVIDTVEEYKDKTPRERTEIVAFSILAMLDGEHVGLPAYKVCPDNDSYDDGWGEDIAGSLHNGFYELAHRQKRQID